jgi:transposase
MAYSKDARELVLKYRENGHTLEQTHREFGISISTIRDWEFLQAENGGVDKRELSRKPSIYKSEELHAYIAQNPDAFLREIAEHFGGSVTGAFDALEREKLTYKKKSANTKKGTKINALNLMLN